RIELNTWVIFRSAQASKVGQFSLGDNTMRILSVIRHTTLTIQSMPSPTTSKLKAAKLVSGRSGACLTWIVTMMLRLGFLSLTTSSSDRSSRRGTNAFSAMLLFRQFQAHFPQLWIEAVSA
ncbi:MAG: hypothetical protein EB071_10340, partial [Gammaproteobacteria bacterium]|nr:hypothetical protein [Gammaproteobacteria bacterium]